MQKLPLKYKSEEQGPASLVMEEAFARAKLFLKDFVDLTKGVTNKVANFDFVQVKKETYQLSKNNFSIKKCRDSSGYPSIPSEDRMGA